MSPSRAVRHGNVLEHLPSRVGAFESSEAADQATVAVEDVDEAVASASLVVLVAFIARRRRPGFR